MIGSWKAAAQAAVGLLLVVALAFGGAWVGRTLDKARQHDALVDRVELLESSREALTAELADRADRDEDTRRTRADINRNLDKVTNEDPAARDYLGEPVPDSVRHAILEAGGLRSVPEPDSD